MHSPRTLPYIQGTAYDHGAKLSNSSKGSLAEYVHSPKSMAIFHSGSIAILVCQSPTKSNQQQCKPFGRLFDHFCPCVMARLHLRCVTMSVFSPLNPSTPFSPMKRGKFDGIKTISLHGLQFLPD